MLRKPLAVVVLLCIVIACSSASAQDYKTEAQNMINTLNPVNEALGPLIDSANNDLRDRLEQLRGIIGEALVNLNAIVKDSTIRLNADGEARLNQLNNHLRENLDLLNGIESHRITQIDQAAQARIDQFETATDQFAESLPIGMQPLPKAPAHGYALVKPVNKDYTVLYISGAGLKKGGTEPKAYFFQGDDSDHHYLWHNGTPLTVMASSMGLIQIKIPKSLFPRQGQADKSIMLKLATNNHLPGSVEPSFPLLLCASVPKYTASVGIEATGYFWKTQVVDYPTYTQPTIKQYRIEDGGSNAAYNICASNADSDGWVADPTVNVPNPDVHARNILFGLEYGAALEHVGALIPNFPSHGCLHLYAGHDRSGGGFAEALGIVVHQRKLFPGTCGSGSLVPQDLMYGINTIDAKPDSFESACVEAKDGAPSSARVSTRLTIKDDAGSSPDVQDLTTSSSIDQSFFNGSIKASIDENGLIRLNVKASCRQDDINYQ
jgi:hypothetical protein